ncbi:hypothetical protein ACFWZ7_14440 [Nocardiopsis alba]
MSPLLWLAGCRIAYYHCGRLMTWNAFRSCYECANASCGATQ